MSNLSSHTARTERFATLLRVTGTYCHPEADGEAYEALKLLARRENHDEEMTRFKKELREALTSPSNALRLDLYSATRYEDRSATYFLHRLWNDLYPGESISRNLK